MAAVLLAPARLNLPLTTVDESLDPDDRQDHDWNSNTNNHHHHHNTTTTPPIVTQRHDYLRSLILDDRCAGNGNRGRAESRDSVFGGRLPETPSSGVCRGTAHHSPVIDTTSMAAVAEEGGGGGGTAAANEAAPPSSPPDLSYSKSSKSSSSSVRSDSSEDDDDDDGSTTEKLSQFDDTSVDERDSIEDNNLRPESRPTLKRPPTRSVTAGDGNRRMASPPVGRKEHRYPNLQNHGVLRDQSLNLPQGRGLRRGFTSPSSPSTLTMHGGLNISSRSPSPTKSTVQNGTSTSPQTLSSSSPRSSGDARSPPLSSGNGTFVRRKSWQPGRKSVRQLEAECDDVDEEVPDDAVLENVPISPLPGQLRMSPRPSRSSTPSPQRRAVSHAGIPSVPSHTNLHSANVPRNAKRPSAPTMLPNGQYGSPRSPRHPRPQTLVHSATMSSLPGDPLSRKQRSKSWTEDLNNESRELSAALEQFAERESSERQCSSGANSVADSPPRPNLAAQRAKTTVMDFPTAQKGNIMIDPLPISKEKEAVLSKTRPSWLPPKDKQEERKHMKEFEQMMARAMENEKKRLLKQRARQENEDEMKDSVAKLWEEHVLPNWESVIREPRTRELWWCGVPPNSRGAVWQKAIGNELGLSESSFDAALKRAVEIEEKMAEMKADERSQTKEAAWFDAIARDVQVACPEFQEPEQRAPFQNALGDVLKAYAMYRNDVGYVYGTHLIAGTLCHHLPPAPAFVTLANLLNRPLPLAFLVHDIKGMARTHDFVLSTLKYKSPHLHAHLTARLNPDELLDPLFRCLFAFHLPAAHTARIWDIFALEGDRVLVRAAVAVLATLETRLYGSREEILDLVSWRNEGVWDLGSEEAFVRAVREAGKVKEGGAAVVKNIYV